MDAINNRLKQLEDIEIILYVQRQATAQRRIKEDEDLSATRQVEDEAYLQALRERDQEEDVSAPICTRCQVYWNIVDRLYVKGGEWWAARPLHRQSLAPAWQPTPHQ